MLAGRRAACPLCEGGSLLLKKTKLFALQENLQTVCLG